MLLNLTIPQARFIGTDGFLACRPRCTSYNYCEKTKWGASSISTASALLQLLHFHAALMVTLEGLVNSSRMTTTSHTLSGTWANLTWLGVNIPKWKPSVWLCQPKTHPIVQLGQWPPHRCARIMEFVSTLEFVDRGNMGHSHKWLFTLVISIIGAQGWTLWDISSVL